MLLAYKRRIMSVINHHHDDCAVKDVSQNWAINLQNLTGYQSSTALPPFEMFV